MLTAQESTPPQAFVDHLNGVLKHSLTGINQYFLHARMLKHKGFMKLADYAYKESLDTMRYTDQLVNLVLTLGGAPNLQELGKLRVGDTVPEILKNDLALVEVTLAALDAALTRAAATNDNEPSVSVLQAMQKSERGHEQFLKGQLSAIATMGINAYLQTQK